ncbi:class F sortase [Sinomonas sp. G460-2]|uniref:class F sortase n=1 Tax=Sinomonas sp. G460-2 TaxID=3393464 RepID=UPI0039EF9535
MENSALAEMPGGRGLRRVLASILAVALFIGVSLTMAQSAGPDTSAQGVQAAPGVSALTVPLPAASPVPAAAPVRLVYSSLGVDMPIQPLTPTPEELAQRTLDPPLTKDAYWLSNYGRPGTGSTDSTFIISHRWIGEDAPFNRIGSGARPGDHFFVQTGAGTLEYAVESVRDYDKATLFDSAIWAIVPNRIVMITCDFNDPWGKNTVVIAGPVRK